MTTRTLTNPCRMEVSTLEYHVLRGFISTATLSSEHTSDTHRLLCITDSQIAVREFMFLTIQRLERCALRHRLHHNLMPFHHISIKRVQRLAIGHHHIVGDIHDIIDRTQANGGEFVLQPIRAFLHLTIRHAHTSIAFAGLLILDDHLDGQVMILYFELRAVRTMQRGLVAVTLQPCIQITSHAPV